MEGIVINDDGNYVCDFCRGASGEFSMITGNHISCEEIERLNKDINQMYRDRQRDMEQLQSTITAQEDIIKRLREDAERLSQNHWYENEEDGKEYCNMCGFPFKKQFSEHDDDCPITLHTQLMNELGEK
jgi:CRISPR/Cas system-associated protein Cas10 (large subunit of type III CRISPR-Cas system)